ncbi:hypothetical protein LTR97_009021 [Elasticomyces elasticus]|uniref:Uncharacterized protein n=1 Tax=Elasticomyces elasticus TaxID=574655 RepID=A0AAN7W168_9PEZI|nr:hypothetical protein LTR97_009021 [Elasticomyces elasticus]
MTPPPLAAFTAAILKALTYIPGQLTAYAKSHWQAYTSASLDELVNQRIEQFRKAEEVTKLDELRQRRKQDYHELALALLEVRWCIPRTGRELDRLPHTFTICRTIGAAAAALAVFKYRCNEYRKLTTALTILAEDRCLPTFDAKEQLCRVRRSACEILESEDRMKDDVLGECICLRDLVRRRDGTDRWALEDNEDNTEHENEIGA